MFNIFEEKSCLHKCCWDWEGQNIWHVSWVIWHLWC